MNLFPRPRLIRGSALERAISAPTLHTQRLVLRPHRMDDAQRWQEIESSPDVRAYTSWPKRTAAESRTHLKHRTKHVELKQADDFLALAIEHDGKLVGDVGLHLRSVSPSTRFAEISWILHPDSYGHGYAAEAATAVMEFAFAEVQIRWLVAIVDPANAASITLASRLGFTQLDNVEGALTFVASGPPARRQKPYRAS
ncbi:GNAT family N-acetyltransferase [Salinibacterium sp. TMP30]|uniref:GNAT family N-acetyltransferase n=1 Tax=Salinibacterium sp. TMP30 TaxID=3138237 RepID=UPI00313A2025